MKYELVFCRKGEPFPYDIACADTPTGIALHLRIYHTELKDDVTLGVLKDDNTVERFPVVMGTPTGKRKARACVKVGESLLDLLEFCKSV